MLITADLCKDVAAEAMRRGAPGNVHELWAALELVVRTGPDLIVDVGSAPAVWWAWWSMCPNVIGVSALHTGAQAFTGERLPSSVVALTGAPGDPATAQRVTDQAGRRPVDVLVMAGAVTADRARLLWGLYAPMVRPGGLVLLRGIANPSTPGTGVFWRDLQTDEREELIGASDPDGYGVVTIPGQVE
jgi:hypothetical protein